MASSDFGPLADPMEEALAFARAGDFVSAFSIWEPLAYAGVSRAQSNLGICFEQGLGVREDRELAFKWIGLAAANGDPVGERNYATLHLQAHSRDVDTAAYYYRRAAGRGDVRAQDQLSSILVDGLVAPTHASEAFEWASKAASQASLAAMTRLGLIYHEAKGVERDPATSVHWWQRAARLGDSEAQAMLGAALSLGSGVLRDDIQALAWLLLAKAGGSGLADRYMVPVAKRMSESDVQEAERRSKTLAPGTRQ